MNTVKILPTKHTIIGIATPCKMI